MWALALVACGGSAPPTEGPPGTPPEACLVPWIESAIATGDRAASSVAADLLSRDVVLLGEHHGIVAEIDFLVAVMDAAVAQGRPFLLAMELVPAAANGLLSDVLQAPTLDAHAWVHVAAYRPWPAPLMGAEYARVFEAAHRAQKAGVLVAMAGLAPDCRVGANADAAAAIQCYKGRDNAMNAHLKALREAHPGVPVLVSAGFRHVSALRLPESPEGLGMLLPAHWSVSRVLLSGPERADGETAWTATCGGILDAVAASVGGPARFRLDHGPTANLTLGGCVDLGRADARPVGRAFDTAIGLPAWTPLTPWTDADVAALPETAYQTWATTARSLMDLPSAPTSAAEWRAWAEAEVARTNEMQPKPAAGCATALP